MDDLEALTAQLRQYGEEITSSPTFPPSKDLLTRLRGTVDQLKARVQQAHADLSADIQATAAELNAKAAALRQQAEARAVVVPKPAVAPPVPEPWEDHQGVTKEQRQGLVCALLGTRPPPRGA